MESASNFNYIETLAFDCYYQKTYMVILYFALTIQPRALNNAVLCNALLFFFIGSALHRIFIVLLYSI